MKSSIAMLVAIAALWGSAAPANANPSVIIDGVTIEGAVSPINSNVDDYFGIPYATAARWEPPKRHARLNNPFDASHVAAVNVCPQPGKVVVDGFTLVQSEDCLSLTVHVPASASAASKLPVYVFIHGGRFQLGAGVEFFPDDMVAATNIIVVTVNYRLGALGWLAQKAIEARRSNSFENAGDAGNYGLMDQLFALDWVKKHVAAFGGDPEKVTVGGQSAGAESALLLLTSTATAQGLFRGAVIQSGAFDEHKLPSQQAYEKRFGNAFVDAVIAATGNGSDCGTLTGKSSRNAIRKCLRGANVSTLLSAQQSVFRDYGISPDTGTRVAPLGLEQAFSRGAFIRVPVLQGNNLNEERLQEPSLVPFSAPLSTIVAAGGPANYDLVNSNSYCGGAVCTYEQEIHLFLASMSLPSSDNTHAFDMALADDDYPLADYPDPYLSGDAPSADEGLAQIGTDYHFACSTLDASKALARYTNVYAYEFDDPLAPPSSANPALTSPPNDQYGYATASEHAAEMAFLFDSHYTKSLSADEQELEATMWTYWSNFTKNLNPNLGGAVPVWPAFTGTHMVQRLVPGPAKSAPFKTFAKEHFCRIWEPILSAE